MTELFREFVDYLSGLEVRVSYLERLHGINKDSWEKDLELSKEIGIVKERLQTLSKNETG